MSRLAGRVSRLAQYGACADFAQRCRRVLREAATAVAQLCTAFDAQLNALRTTMPAWSKVGPQMTHLGKQMVHMLQDLVERPVDASQRTGLSRALREAFEREARR